MTGTSPDRLCPRATHTGEIKGLERHHSTDLHGDQSIVHHNFLRQTKYNKLEVNERILGLCSETYKSAPMVALY